MAGQPQQLTVRRKAGLGEPLHFCLPDYTRVRALTSAAPQTPNASYRRAPAAELTRFKASLATNIVNACNLTGFPAHPKLLAACSFQAAEPDPLTAPGGPPPAAPGPELIAIRGPIGAPNVRALCAALLARGSGLDGVPYHPVKRIELLDSGANDSGAGSIADVLRNGALVGVTVESVALVRSGVGPEGAGAIGASLMLGANSTCARAGAAPRFARPAAHSPPPPLPKHTPRSFAHITIARLQCAR